MRTTVETSRTAGEALPRSGSVRAGQEALRGHRRGLHAVLPFIACVAYIDPGNVATNISSGAQFLGWWWADSVAALAFLYWLQGEAREALDGRAAS